MEWKRVTPPAQLHACPCGGDHVEVRPDGLVRAYRCCACHRSLGDITMGHEP